MSLPQWITPSGTIATITEGNFFTFPLDFNNPLLGTTTVSIVSGSLPNGLSIDSNGVISGTASLVPVPSTHQFVVRLENTAGISDRTFSIEIDEIAPTWGDPNNLGSFPFNSYFSYQFFVLDPGGKKQEFEKISGELPGGLTLDKNGELSGVFKEVSSNITFNFTIRAKLDGDKFEDKTFSLEVTTSGNKPPIWFTPSGLIGEIFGNVPFSFQFIADDPEGGSLNYTASGLPPGFSLTSSGLLQGTLPTGSPQIFSFSISASDTISSVSRTFKLNTNQVISFPIAWTTPSGILGSICEGEVSLFKVSAKSDSRTLFYEVTSGSLPNGLELNPNNGEIWGKVLEQGNEQTYVFEITASNKTESQSRQFSITVEDCLNPSSQEIVVPITGTLRDQYFNLNANPAIAYAYGDWFRQGDSEFGVQEIPEIKIVCNIDNATFDDIYDEIKDLVGGDIIFGEVKSKEVFEDDKHVYDILYRTVYDQQEGSLEEFISPSTGATIKPGSIGNVRNRLIARFGFSGGTGEIVPRYFSDEWFPAVIFAFVKPTLGQAIADEINQNDVDNKELEKVEMKFDRILVKPFADNSFESTFILGFEN